MSRKVFWVIASAGQGQIGYFVLADSREQMDEIFGPLSGHYQVVEDFKNHPFYARWMGNAIQAQVFDLDHPPMEFIKLIEKNTDIEITAEQRDEAKRVDDRLRLLSGRPSNDEEDDYWASG